MIKLNSEDNVYDKFLRANSNDKLAKVSFHKMISKVFHKVL